MSEGESSPILPVGRVLAALVIFGVAFGYVEGAVVVDLRAIYDPLHRQLRPDTQPGDLFPILRLEELRAAGPDHVRRLLVELGREAATLVMLATVPCLFARNLHQWIAGFMIGFGVWDLAYYATLKLAIDWPDSFLTWDLLFLIPIPWSGPVLAPVLVSLSIIAAGVILLRREAAGRPISISRGHWGIILAGGLVVILSFCWEGRSVMAGIHPGSFPWWVFASGEATGLVAFGRACREIRA